MSNLNQYDSRLSEPVSRVLRSGSFILGREVANFEAAWASVCGTKEAIGVGNGLDAIEIALRASGIGPGDEVITSGMSAFATSLGILRAGATPVIADIDPESALLSPESAAECITPNTRAVMVVHLYGQLKDMDKWVDFTESKGIALYEDCAQAHLASLCGRQAGSFGVAGAYSFYPTKNLGALGDAGALVTSNDAIASKARALRDYGQSSKYVHDHLGLNSRLDELQAAILSARLVTLAEETARRVAVADFYRENLSSDKVFPLQPPQESSAHVYHLFVVRTEDREGLQEHLFRLGIDSLVHYPTSAHLQGAGANIRVVEGGVPNTIRHSETCLSIPCHPGLSAAEMGRVVDAINSY